MARITISLMQEFDKLTNDIIIIAATNRMDRIDEALLRRFSVKHEVQEFSNDEKIELLRRFLNDIKVELPSESLNEIIFKCDNQSMLINELIRLIAKKIYSEIAS